MSETKRRRPVESFLGPLIDALPEAVFVVDSEARIAAANDAARMVLPSLRLKDPLARSLRSPDVLDALDRVLAGGPAEKVVWVERLPVECWFEVHLAPLRMEDVEPAAVVSLRDLTEARRVERMRVDFVANASHELRTPLASLLGFVETLQGPAREDAEARQRFLGIMREQGQRMARLVDDLLSLSRIEQHLHLRPDTLVDLNMLVAHIADTLAPMAEEGGLALESRPRRECHRPRRPRRIGSGHRKSNGKRHQIRAARERRAKTRGDFALVRLPASRCSRFATTAPASRRSISPADRALLSGGPGQEPRQGRHRPGSRHRQAYPCAPSGPAGHRVRAGEWRDVQGFPAARRDMTFAAMRDNILIYL